MADIVLSYNDDDCFNRYFVKNFQQDVETKFGISVDSDTKKWEKDPSTLSQAKVLVILSTKQSNISAWIMTSKPNKPKSPRNGNRKLGFPLMIDFTKSYERGVEQFSQVLIFCASKFPLPSYAKKISQNEKAPPSYSSCEDLPKKTTDMAQQEVHEEAKCYKASVSDNPSKSIRVANFLSRAYFKKKN